MLGAELSGSAIESRINDTTERIAEASNALTLSDYSGLALPDERLEELTNPLASKDHITRCSLRWP